MDEEEDEEDPCNDEDLAEVDIANLADARPISNDPSQTLSVETSGRMEQPGGE